MRLRKSEGRASRCGWHGLYVTRAVCIQACVMHIVMAPEDYGRAESACHLVPGQSGAQTLWWECCEQAGCTASHIKVQYKVWWHSPIPALMRLWQDDCQRFEVAWATWQDSVWKNKTTKTKTKDHPQTKKQTKPSRKKRYSVDDFIETMVLDQMTVTAFWISILYPSCYCRWHTFSFIKL